MDDSQSANHFGEAKPRSGDDLLDLRGLKCPLPAMKTRQALGRLPAGATLTVLASDPMSAIDIPHAVAAAGGQMLAQGRDGSALSFRIRKQG
jgi:tRNA 2-thiouridine synthesizing protein A